MSVEKINDNLSIEETEDYTIYHTSDGTIKVPKSKLKRVFAVQDESGHWYVIPFEMREDFFKDEAAGGDDEFEAFNEKYGYYMTGGDLNLAELYAKI